MTDFALAGKCGCFGASGSSNLANSSAIAIPGASALVNPKAPAPYTIFSKNSLRDLLLLMIFPLFRCQN